MKELVIQGRVYLENSARSPIMVCSDDRICSLETILKEADLFQPVKPRTGLKVSDYSGMTYKVNKKVTKQDVKGQFKPMRITVTIEDL